jgi:hypothetical protein
MLAGALALSASPLIGVQVAGAADPLPPVANPIADGAFCDGAPTTNPFTDLGAETASTRKTILCLVATKLTTGTSANKYSPGDPVTRRQMALFIKRLADLLDKHDTGKTALPALPAYDGTSDYSDVVASDPGASAIGQLTQADIVGGFPDGTFRPNAPVSRRQMAAFVNNLQDFLAGSPYTTTKDFFTDDEGDSGEDNLNALAAVGIFQGDGKGRVFPGAAISRRQMANVLLRDAQVYFANGYVSSPFAAGNATFTVTPTTTATQEPATEPSTADDRLYTVTGLQAGTNYRIQLFPAANVHGTKTITFTEDGVSGTADEGTIAADITAVNGTPVGGADDDATGQPVGGQMTFTVDGAAVELVVPVIYKDADADLHLDLKADNTPVDTEPFGVGGQVRYLAPEATLGTHAFNVTLVTLERDAFVSGGATYYMDANDIYRYQGAPITRAQFNSMLSEGDTGTSSYNPDPAGISTFDITFDVVGAPATPSVTVVAAVNGTKRDDARITYTRPATNSPGVTYALQRAPVNSGPDNVCGSGGDDGLPSAWTSPVPTPTQAPGSGPGVFVFSDNNVPDGCFTYRIRATSPISNATADSGSPAATKFPAPADTTAPTSTSAAMTDRTGVDNTFDTGDEVTIVFSEPMAAPVAGDTLQLRDGDFTIADITNGTNATFKLNAAGTVLTITLDAAPTIVFPLPPIPATLQVPATIQSQTGITDTSGNDWDISGSDDVEVD